MPYNEKDIERFWSKVNKTDTCWLWTVSCFIDGYGKWAIGTRKTVRQFRAHRFAWEICNGPIPKGRQVLHSCDVRKCVNPNHLFLGSLQDNMNDMLAKGRQANGERNARTKLTENQAKKIKSDTRLLRTIAAEYGITEGHVSQIRNGIVWKHI